MNVPTKVVDTVLCTAFAILVLFTGYNLFKNNIFQASDFCEGVLMLVCGKGTHVGINVVDKYFNGDKNA